MIPTITKGYTEGEIQEADDFGTGKIPNVMYVLDTPSDFTSDVTLLVVDVKNNLHGSFNFVFGADAAKTDLVNALAKADKITVDAAAIRNAGSINVAADKTVVVTGTDLSDVFGNLKGAKGATLIVKEETDVNSTPRLTRLMVRIPLQASLFRLALLSCTTAPTGLLPSNF